MVPSAVTIDAASRYSSTPRPAPGAGVAPVERRSSATTRGGRNSGHTPAAMTKRMARIAEMITMPPSTTVRAAKRSRKIRRLVRARLTTSGRAGVPGPPAVRVSALIATLLDLVLLFLRDGRGDREVAVLDDTLLPLARNDELDELAGQRVERLAGRLVDVHVEKARQGIAARVGVVRRRLDALAAVLLGQRHRAHAGRGVANAAVADAVAVHRDALDDRRRARLLLDLVLVVAVLERVLLEEAVGARGRVAAVEAQRPVGPLTRQPELTPRPEVVLCALTTRLREDGVDLDDREARDRVVLVHEHGERVHRRADRRGLVAVLLLERVDFRALHLARHRPELRGAADERGRRRRRALALDLDLGVGIKLLEALRPVGHEVVEGIRADARDVAAHAAHRLVGREVRIELRLADGRASRHRQRGHGQRHHGLHRHRVVSFGYLDHPPCVFRRHKGGVTFVLRAGGLPEPVAHAPDGFHPRGRELGSRELGAQAGDVDVDGPGLHEAIPPPHRVQQLLAAEDAPGRAGQDREQLELLGGEVHRVALHADLEAVAVDLELADLHVRLLLGVAGTGAAGDRADAGEQLARRERLGHVVVGAHLEAEDLVTLLDAAGVHDHGDVLGVRVLLE